MLFLGYLAIPEAGNVISNAVPRLALEASAMSVAVLMSSVGNTASRTYAEVPGSVVRWVAHESFIYSFGGPRSLYNIHVKN